MHKRIMNILLSFLSLAFLAFMVSENVFAADASSKTDTPKDAIICIMVITFIVTAVITGFFSFRIKKKSINRSEKNSSKETKDQ